MTIAIVLAAGGTGGHLVPALAVADTVRALRADATVTFIGSTRQMERALVESRGYAVASTGATSFGSVRDLPRTLVRLARATRESRRILRQVRAQAVCGFGGYPSLPPMIAAALSRLPRMVHEANALPHLGLANRVAARAGAEIWAGFDVSGAALRRPVHLCGVPIRRELAGLDRAAARSAGRARFGRSEGATVALVMGGSLGAARINEAITALVDRGLPDDLELIWSIGGGEYDASIARHGTNPRLTLAPYIDEMALAYAAADIVIARAGASTVAELEQLGMRALLVPLAIARLGEQDLNARVLVRRGGAATIPEAELGPERLLRELTTLLSEPEPAPDARHGGAAAMLAERLVALAEGTT